MPLGLVQDVALIGPVDKIRDELQLWRETCMTTMLIGGNPEQLRQVADLVRS